MANTTKTAIAETTNDDLSALMKRSKARFEQRKKTYSKIAAANTRLADSDGYAVVGTLQMEAYVIYTSVKINNITFTDGSGTVNFDGGAWGVGGGTMVGAGVGYMAYSPSELVALGKVSFSVQAAGVGVGGLEIEIWNDNGFVGEMTFGGLNFVLGAFIGSGEFSL